MAGYRPERKTYKLKFDQFPGLKVTMRSTSLGNLQEIMSTQTQNLKYAETRTLFEKISNLIKEWNVEHPETDNSESCDVCGLKEGEPVPATVDGLMCLDLEFITAIIFAWGNAIVRVSVPKGMNSRNGEPPIPEDLMKQLENQQNPLTS